VWEGYFEFSGESVTTVSGLDGESGSEANADIDR
jgi:hypothetical protein